MDENQDLEQYEVGGVYRSKEEKEKIIEDKAQGVKEVSIQKGAYLAIGFFIKPKESSGTELNFQVIPYNSFPDSAVVRAEVFKVVMGAGSKEAEHNSILAQFLVDEFKK